MKCSICKKPKATYKCDNCGAWVCAVCADEMFFEHDCLPQPRLVLMRPAAEGKVKR